MEYVDAIIILIVGFVLIIKGADWFVDSASWIARIAGVSDIIIGATVVSIGTTLPEFISSLTSAILGTASTDPAAAENFFGISVSNSIGSMFCNTALILAIVMLIKPPKVKRKGFMSKGIFLLVVTTLFSVFAITGSGDKGPTLDLWEGIVLLVLFVAFMTMNVFEAKSESKLDADSMKKAEEKAEALTQNKAKMIGMLILGAGCIAGGAYLLVQKSEWLCQQMGIPGQIAGITVVAIGTSLPEFVTSITALRKGKSDIGVGNIIGANIINATLIIGTISVISGQGMQVDWITSNVISWVVLGVMCVLVIPSIFLKKTTRVQGGIMLAAYLGTMAYNVAYVIQNTGGA